MFLFVAGCQIMHQNHLILMRLSCSEVKTAYLPFHSLHMYFVCIDLLSSGVTEGG